ncbi:MAG: V-type ATP synthase subunit F [Candidatus Krumholzibacteriota bacterium]|nr:V-type ATP synthase subunit F [Candidatus Krumholzibacteriota bacterium]
MAKRIAVVGNLDSVSYFRILGCRIFETVGGELTNENIELLKKDQFEIIFVTEEVFLKYREFFRDELSREGSSVTIIPDIRGAVWKDGKPSSSGVSVEETRKAVIRAIGQDISGS